MKKDTYEINSNTYRAKKDYLEEEYELYLNDQINDGFGGGCDDKYLDFLTRKLLPNVDYENLNILDVGARQFDGYDYWLTNFSNKITGIDVCKIALEKAKKDKKPLLALDAHVMDEELEHSSFDLITAFHSFEHMYDLPRVISNCYKLLKPNGYLYFALPMPSYNWKRGHWYDVPNNEFMVEMCEKEGFTYKWDFLSRNQKFRPNQEMLGLFIK